MKNKTIILRMTNTCNLDCKYCYDKYNHVSTNQENIDFESKIPNIINNIQKIWQNRDEKSELIFHGGEPLIINTTNYRLLIDGLKKIYPYMRFSIQTNATLINQEYIDLFKDYGIHVGISLDGYDVNTNKYRVYKNGRNSFGDVIDKIRLLKKNNMRFGIIMTINNNIVNNELELYNFIKKYNVNCNIRPAFKCSNLELDYISEEEYYAFFTNLFNIWINDKNADVKFNQIKEIQDEFIKNLNSNYNCNVCSGSGHCFNNFISLDRNGNVYSCNRTYNNQEFFYGNLEEISMDDIEEKIEKINKSRRSYIENSKCKSCILYTECHGGCPATAFSLHGCIESADDSFCNARKKIRMYVNEYLEKNNIKKEYLEKVKNE